MICACCGEEISSDPIAWLDFQSVCFECVVGLTMLDVEERDAAGVLYD